MSGFTCNSRGEEHLSSYVTSHPCQLSLAIPSWVGAMSTSQRRAVTPCGCRVKADNGVGEQVVYNPIVTHGPYLSALEVETLIIKHYIINLLFIVSCIIYRIHVVESLGRRSILMHYFQNVVSFWELRPWTTTGASQSPLHPAGGLSSPYSLICPPLKKNSAGAHVAARSTVFLTW